MSYTDQDVERVAEAIWHEDYFWNTGVYPDHEDENHIPITWDRESKPTQRWGRSVARAALEAMVPESLEDVLEPDNVTDVHVMWCRTGDDEGEWRAFLNRDQIVSAERTWFGTGATIDEAIRNAIAVAKDALNNRRYDVSLQERERA